MPNSQSLDNTHSQIQTLDRGSNTVCNIYLVSKGDIFAYLAYNLVAEQHDQVKTEEKTV